MALRVWSSAALLVLAGSMCALAGGQQPGNKSQHTVAGVARPGPRAAGNLQPGMALHQRIDALVEAAAIGPLAPLCSDADFVRRVYLDLTGVIPSADEARAFVINPAPNKRERLVERLLASDAFVRHMTMTLDVMLMERKPEKSVKQPEWEAYLYRSVAQNKPLDHLFRELVGADGADEALRPAARFTLDRDAEPNLLTRDIGRLAFGMDLQCCQCHDHPLIDDYYQDDYYGLYAFVHRTSLFTDAKTKLVSLTEKADGDASFKSVFTGEGNDRARPRLPKGPMLLAEPVFAKGEEYAVKPDKTVRGVPKFSRRAALAELLPGSREFSRNLANRLWAQMLGRGLVHPLDFHYAANPPSNPRLLSLLADELAAGGFQVRPLLRAIALSRVYQRSCDAPRPEVVNLADVAARLAQLQNEKEARTNSLVPLKEALAAAKAQFKSGLDEEVRAAAEIAQLERSLADARQAHDKATTALNDANAAAEKLRAQLQSIGDAAEKLTAAVAALPGDPSLAKAHKEVLTAADRLRETHEAASKAAAERKALALAAGKALALAQAKLDQAVAARPSPEQLRELEQVQLAAEHRLSEEVYAARALDGQISFAQAILDHAALAKIDPVKADAAFAALVERWTIAGQIAPLKPLTPEQLAASAMQATGMFAPQVAAVQEKIEKSPPESLNKSSDSERPAARSMAVQLELLTQLRGTFGEFVRQYGGQPGSEFQATVNQALFFGNGTIIDGWLKPAGDNLVARLAKLADSGQLADELAWAVYSRPATESDRQAAASYLLERTDRAAAVGEMVWGLLSSTEFRFNH